MKFVRISLCVAVSALALSFNGCSYPGGMNDFVKVKSYGSRVSIKVDDDATKKLLEFTMAPRDEKFARSVVAADTALAGKYATPGNVNKPIKGVPPLGVAAAMGNEAMVTMLLSKGANPKAKSFNEISPAGYAAQFGHLRLAKSLVGAGAGTNADVQKGSRVYAVNEERRRQRNVAASKMAFEFARLFIRAVGDSGGSSSSGSCKYCGGGLGSNSQNGAHPGCLQHVAQGGT